MNFLDPSKTNSMRISAGKLSRASKSSNPRFERLRVSHRTLLDYSSDQRCMASRGFRPSRQRTSKIYLRSVSHIPIYSAGEMLLEKLSSFSHTWRTTVSGPF